MQTKEQKFISIVLPFISIFMYVNWGAHTYKFNYTNTNKRIKFFPSTYKKFSAFQTQRNNKRNNNNKINIKKSCSPKKN